MVLNALEELTHQVQFPWTQFINETLSAESITRSQEVHFIAEDEEIIIVPNFSLPQVGGKEIFSTLRGYVCSICVRLC